MLQTILTLTLLCQSNLAPKISSCAYHNGPFDYIRVPLAPLGCTLQIHVKPNTFTHGKHIPWMAGTSVPRLKTIAHMSFFQGYFQNLLLLHHLLQTQICHATNCHSSTCHSQSLQQPHTHVACTTSKVNST